MAQDVRVAQHEGHADRLAAVDLPGQAERQQHPERHGGNGEQAALLARIVAQQERAEELAVGHHDLAHDAGLLAVGSGSQTLSQFCDRRRGGSGAGSSAAGAALAAAPRQRRRRVASSCA